MMKNKLRLAFMVILGISLLGAYTHTDAARPVPAAYKIPRSLGLDMNNLLLDKFSQAIGPIISNFDISEIEGMRIDLILGSYVIIDKVHLNHGGEPYGFLEAIPPDDLRIKVIIPRIKIDMTVYFLGTYPGDVQAHCEFTSILKPGFDDFKFGLEAQDMETTITDIDANFSGLVGSIIEFLIDTVFPGLIQEYAAAAIEEEIGAIFNGEPLFDVMDLLAEALASSPCFQSSHIDTEVADSNGYYLALEAGLYPLLATVALPFDRTLPNILPPYGLQVPGTERQYHAAFSLSDDLLNEILLLAAKTEFLQMTVDNCILPDDIPIRLTAGLIAILVPELLEHFPSASPVTIDLYPIESPKAYMSQEDGLLISTDALELTFNVVDEGTAVKAFSAAVDITLQIEPDWNMTTNKFEIKADFLKDPETGQPIVDAYFSDMGVLEHTTQEELIMGLRALLYFAGGFFNLTELINPLLDELSNVEFWGLTPVIQGALLNGGQGDYLTLYLWLDGELEIPPMTSSVLLASADEEETAPVNNYVAVSNYNQSQINIYKAFTMEPTEPGTYTTGANTLPKGIFYNRKNYQLYVVCDGSGGPGGIAVFNIHPEIALINEAPVVPEASSYEEIIFNYIRDFGYALNRTRGSIDVLDINTTLPALVDYTSQSLSAPKDLAIDPYKRLIYVTDQGNGSVKIFDSSPVKPAFIKTIDLAGYDIINPDKILYNPEKDILYITDESNGSVTALGTINSPDTFELLGRSFLGGYVSRLLLDAVNDRLFAINQPAGKFFVLDVNNASVLVASAPTTVPNPTEMSLHPAGLLYVTDSANDQLYILHAMLLSDIYGTPFEEGDGPYGVLYFTTAPADTSPPVIEEVQGPVGDTEWLPRFIFDANPVYDDVALGELHLLFERYHDGQMVQIKKDMARVQCDHYQGRLQDQPGESMIVYRIEAFDKSYNRTVSDRYTFSIPEPTPSPTPTVTPTPTPTQTPTPLPTDTPDPNATPTPTPTNTPDPNATPTPTATPKDRIAPYIMVGGYWDTDVTSTYGGRFVLCAYIPDEDLRRADVYYQGFPTGLSLVDDGTQGDFNAGDRLYMFATGVGGGAPVGIYPLTIHAYDYENNISVWPYLECKE